MNLISFFDQFHDFLKTQAPNPSLGKAIAKAEKIISESNAEQMSMNQLLQAMHKVSACFEDSPNIQEGVQTIILAEIKKIALVGEKILVSPGEGNIAQTKLHLEPAVTTREPVPYGPELTSLIAAKEAAAKKCIAEGRYEEAFKLRSQIAQMSFPLDHPLADMEQAVVKGSEGKPLPRMGAYFQGLDTGSVKMGTIHASKRRVIENSSDANEEPKECFCFDFNLTHTARQELDKTVEVLQSHPEALQQSLGRPIRISSPQSQARIPAYRMEDDVYLYDGGPVAGTKLEIEVGGVGKIRIYTDPGQHSLNNRVEVILNAESNQGSEGLKNLHAILSLLGLGTTLCSSRPEDENRMKIFILLHAYFPALSYQMERDPDNYNISVEELRQKISTQEPNAGAILKKYLDTNPELFVKEELYAGRHTYMIKDMGDQVRDNACGLIFGTKSYDCLHMWEPSPELAEETFRQIAAGYAQKLKAGVAMESNREDWLCRGDVSAGFSAGKDMQVGGTDSVYTRLFPKSFVGKEDLSNISFCEDGIRVLVDTDCLGYASCYANPEDRYGARVDTSNEIGLPYSKRLGLPEFACQMEKIADEEVKGVETNVKKNEVMIRDLLPTKFVRAIVIKRQAMKDILVDEFKKAGLIQEREGTECVVLPGCVKPVNEFFYVGDMCQAEMWAKPRSS